ncbi:hypothetical protein PF008_g21686 [Phytophthora fragariae]|nr:hypothetical protein PF008_g21686 [Phytophthora fragariae]
MTADQRSLVVAAVVIPKLLYIGRHQWPSKKLIASFQRMIQNFVWHARFTEDKVEGRAWLDQQVAELPRKDGGLAIPDLKLELLAHAAVTVNAWALDADTSTLIVGDVVAGDGACSPARQLYVSPRHTPRPKQTPRITESLWTTGLSLCNAYGGVVALTDKVAMVVALGWLLQFRGPLTHCWRGCRLHLDASALSGSLWQRYTAVEATSHGLFCTEWVPYLVLSDLRLISEAGKLINPRVRFWSICSQGVQLKDIIHWSWTSPNCLIVTALGTPLTKTMQRHVGYLMQVMLLNYPQLLVPGGHHGEIRYSTKDEGHIPITRGLNSQRQFINLTEGQHAEAGLPLPLVTSHQELLG